MQINNNYKKQEYDKKFELLGRNCKGKKKLVKHSLEEIENSDLFKYSPYKELNDNQRNAVETIIQRIREEDTNRIVIMECQEVENNSSSLLNEISNGL